MRPRGDASGSHCLSIRACLAAALYCSTSLAQPIVKRGTGWDYRSTTVGPELDALPSLSWFYNWGNGIPDTAGLTTDQVSSAEFVPMVYGNCCGIDDPGSLPTNSTVLLGFNEPNHGEESNLTPEHAAALWPRLEMAAEKLGLALGSPAAAPCGANCVTRSPFDWWDQFFGNCTAARPQGCRVDFMATHYYTCSAQYLQYYLNDVSNRYNRSVWLTEWACPNENGTLARQIRFMRQGLNVLDADDAVERYAWFAPHTEGFGWIGPTASLIELDSDPPRASTLGKVYSMGGGKNASSAIPEGVDASSATPLSALDIAALTEPVQAIQRGGSWLSVCADCYAGEGLLFELTDHCMDCGLLTRSPESAALMAGLA